MIAASLSPAIKRTRLFAASCTGMFMFGIVLALLGTLFGLPQVHSRLHIDLVQKGDLFLLLYLCICLATLGVGPLIDRFGNKPVLLVSSLLVAGGLLAFAAAQSFWAAAAATLALGSGGGGLNTAANVLASDLYPENRGPMLNILGVFYGFGALFMPLVTASVATRIPIPELLIASAILPAMCGILYALLTFPATREPHAISLQELAEVLRHPGLLLFGFLLLIESGNEAVLGGWTSSYLITLGAQARIATWVLAGYWAGLMLGRVAASRLLRWLKDVQLVLLSAAVSLATCAVLLLVRSLPLLAVAVASTGFAFSAIFPTILAMAGDRYQRNAGTVFGVLFAVGLAGGAVFPWGVGHISQAYSVRAGMALPMIGAAVNCITIWMIRRRQIEQQR
ncbi:MAG TPA: MFS transporter [Terriglobales bacterium]|nr:MFS transporter [Terriglobales bacterium]